MNITHSKDQARAILESSEYRTLETNGTTCIEQIRRDGQWLTIAEVREDDPTFVTVATPLDHQDAYQWSDYDESYCVGAIEGDGLFILKSRI